MKGLGAMLTKRYGHEGVIEKFVLLKKISLRKYYVDCRNGRSRTGRTIGSGTVALMNLVDADEAKKKGR